jgi:hypothetical protein
MPSLRSTAQTPKFENETLKPSDCWSFFPVVDLPLQILENLNQRNKLWYHVKIPKP